MSSQIRENMFFILVSKKRITAFSLIVLIHYGCTINFEQEHPISNKIYDFNLLYFGTFIISFCLGRWPQSEGRFSHLVNTSLVFTASKEQKKAFSQSSTEALDTHKCIKLLYFKYTFNFEK